MFYSYTFVQLKHLFGGLLYQISFAIPTAATSKTMLFDVHKEGYNSHVPFIWYNQLIKCYVSQQRKRN